MNLNCYLWSYFGSGVCRDFVRREGVFLREKRRRKEGRKRNFKDFLI